MEEATPVSMENVHTTPDSQNDEAEAQQENLRKNLFACETCYQVFKEKRYLATHVKTNKCKLVKNSEYQCTVCGKRGDAAWAATHEFAEHYKAWSKSYRCPR